MQIEIIGTSSAFTKTDKGGYSTLTVEFLDERAQAKTKKLVSFANPKIYDTLKDSRAGETYEIATKQDGQYLNWASADKVDASVKNAAAPAAKAGPVASQYETRDERNARQRLIVRQSSLSAAVTTLSPGAKGPVDKDQVKALANEYTAWVYEAPDLFEAPNDIPY